MQTFPFSLSLLGGHLPFFPKLGSSGRSRLRGCHLRAESFGLLTELLKPGLNGTFNDGLTSVVIQWKLHLGLNFLAFIGARLRDLGLHALVLDVEIVSRFQVLLRTDHAALGRKLDKRITVQEFLELRVVALIEIHQQENIVVDVASESVATFEQHFFGILLGETITGG